MGMFTLKQVPKSVTEELDYRASDRGLEWTATRFPWVHIQSFAKLADGSDPPLTVLESLGNSQSIDETLYQQPEFSDKPMVPNPVVTSVKIKKKGELGTTREAQVALSVFTDEQLSDVQQAFLIPGMTVRIQFGWSTTAAKLNQSGQARLYTENPQSDSIAMCKMQAIANEQTNYAGIQGMVSNFSYNLVNGGQWDCTFTLIAASEPLAASKIDNMCCECVSTVRDEEEDKEEYVPDLLKFFHVLGENFAFYKRYPKLFQNEHSLVGQYAFEGDNRNPDGSDPKFWSLSASGSERIAAMQNVFAETAEETFISFAALEEAINFFAFPKDKDDKPSLGKIDSSVSFIRNHPRLESLDPRVCVIGGTNKVNDLITDKRGALPDAVRGDRIFLPHVMINTIFLAGEFRKNSESLSDFLRSVLNRINEVCGGLWEFEIVSSTEDCDVEEPIPSISVIDMGGAIPAPPTNIKTYPNNTAVRELKLDMKLTQSMKTQALYSNRSSASTQTCNKAAACEGVGLRPFGLAPSPGGEVRIINSAIKPSVKLTEAERKKRCECGEDPEGDEPEKPPTFDELFEELTDKVDDLSVNNAINALTKIMNESPEDDPKCKMLVTPFEFSFTVDGIGGFKFGQALTSDAIPKSLRNDFLYQITAVEHELTIQDWTTNIITIARYNPR